MKSQIFEKKIKPLMDIVNTLCEEEGINFLANFTFNEEDRFYHYRNGKEKLPTDVVFSEYQKIMAASSSK